MRSQDVRSKNFWKAPVKACQKVDRLFASHATVGLPSFWKGVI